jgi:hypothetical protein
MTPLHKGRRLEVGAQSLISWLSMPVQAFAAQLNMFVSYLKFYIFSNLENNMKWLVFLVAGIIGAIAGLISSAIISKIFKNSSKLALINRFLHMVCVLIFIYLGNIFIMPYVEEYTLRTKVENEFTKLEKQTPVFKYIKENDAEGYKIIINKYINLFDSKTNLSGNEINLMGYNMGAQAMQKYFKYASADSMYLYLTRLTNYFKYFYNKNPIILAKILFPANFGLADNQNEILNEQSNFKVSDSLCDIIKSGVRKDFDGDNLIGAYELNSFRDQFFKNNPSHAYYINKLNSIRSEEEIAKVSFASMQLYEDLIKQEKQKAVRMFRAVLVP